MKRDTPLFVEEEEESPVAADAWCWNSKPEHCPSTKNLTSDDLAWLTAQFLADGGQIQQLEIGASALKLEVETVTYKTKAGFNQQITRFTSKDMSQRSLNERRYSHAQKTARRMLAKGHSVREIADAVGFTESHTQGIITAMMEARP